MQPLVSVVTPVYNGQEFLADCIESVLVQTYQNWEYLIVDNHSTDGTAEIIEGYARREPRIRAVHNEEFLGALENHNHALRQIAPESKYCKIVQADDWLFPECLERMMELAEQHPSVGLVGSYQLSDRWIEGDGLPYPSPVISGREACRLFLLDGIYPFGTPTSVMYRSEVVRNRMPFYNEDNIFADTEVCLELLNDSDFGFVHQVLTYTRIHEESQTATTADRLRTYYPAMLYLLERFGPRYLTPDEQQRRIREFLREYNIFLARCIIEGREREFWEFHGEALKEYASGLNRVKLYGLAGLELGSRLFKKIMRSVA